MSRFSVVAQRESAHKSVSVCENEAIGEQSMLFFVLKRAFGCQNSQSHVVETLKHRRDRPRTRLRKGSAYRWLHIGTSMTKRFLYHRIREFMCLVSLCLVL